MTTNIKLANVYYENTNNKLKHIYYEFEKSINKTIEIKCNFIDDNIKNYLQYKGYKFEKIVKDGDEYFIIKT